MSKLHKKFNLPAILKDALPYATSILLGLLAFCALPPTNLSITLPIAFSCLLELLYNAHTSKKRFWLGFCFGYGHFIVALSWVGNALMVEAEKFSWLKPFALLLIPAILGCYIGIAALISTNKSRNRIVFLWIFSINWVAIELIRSYLLIPFPWNLIGYSFSASLALSQLSSILGIYGLSLLAILIGGVFFTRSIKSISIAILILTGSYFFGLNALNMGNNSTKHISLRIVQPNPAKHHLGDPKEQLKQIMQLINLSNNSGIVDAILWPEAAFPIILNEPIVKMISNQLPRNTWLISGADIISDDNEKTHYYNSIISSNQGGDLVSQYNKHLLVPFGEYIPLRWLFPKFIEKIAYGLGDLTLGKEFPLIKIGESYALPIICYEALFSTYISNFDLNKAEFIVNVTNDNWFGDSIGPHQHLAMARFRAIEYGKPLIRIANTGISAAFDRFGKNLDSIPLNHQGIIDLKIDITQRAKTFYGTNIVWLSNTLLLLICMTNALNLLFHNKQAIYKNGSRIIS